VSGLTSLGYQTLWTRLLASGTGGSTYVFTVILALFLVGLAVGAVLFATLRRGIRNWVALLAACQIATAALAITGLVRVISQPRSIASLHLADVFQMLFSAALPVVLPTTIVMGLAFPAASALLADRSGRVATAAGQLLAANTFGAICGTFLIPFVVIPAMGSPTAVVLLALVNAATGIALALARLGGRTRAATSAVGALVAAAIVATAVRPGLVVDPTVARILNVGGRIDASTEDEIASTQAGQLGRRKRLWVGGTSMTSLTVDAKLMTIVPVMLRPDAERALVVAFGMGSSFVPG